jgi:hypothetical protein
VTAGAGRTWQVVGPDGRPHDSPVPGKLGGDRRGRIYGRRDCRAALRALTRGGYHLTVTVIRPWALHPIHGLPVTSSP